MTHTKVPLRRALLFVAVVCAGCAIDLGTKSWIFADRGMPYEKPPIVLIFGSLHLAGQALEANLQAPA